MSIQRYFAGKRVAITGGSSGIGLAMADQLISAGASVVLVARRESLLQEARAALLQKRPQADVEVRACDVAEAAAVEQALGAIAKARLEAVICSAGVTLPGRFLELPAEEFRREMEVNYFGTVNVCRTVLPHFVARKAGHVIQVSSLAGVIGVYGYSAYTPTKFALAGLCQTLRAELWPHGIRVTIAHPPDTETPMLAAELPYRPPETQAIAGTVKALPAEKVARAILEGAARGDFDVYPGLASRLFALAQGAAPALVRRITDAAQKKARTAR